MHEDFRDIELQRDLLALNAMIEAARAGESGKCFAQQAAALRNLPQAFNGDPGKIHQSGDLDAALHEFETRLHNLARRQDEISLLAAEIEANSRGETRALQFEDVESQVVVYSNAPATELRALVAQIEAQRSALKAGIAINQDDLRLIADSLRQQLGALSDEDR